MQQTYKFPVSSEWIERLCQSLGIKPSETQHIILDIQSDRLVTVHVQMIGSERTLQVIAPSVDPARIEIVDVPPTSEA